MTIATDAPVYAIVIGSDIDWERMKPYVAGIGSAYSPHAHAVTPIGTTFETVEGEAPESVRMVRWTSKAAFEAFWYSDAYQELKKHREGAGRFTILLLEDETARGD